MTQSSNTSKTSNTQSKSSPSTIQFDTFSALLETCNTMQCSIADAALNAEVQHSDVSREDILQRMDGILTQMEATIEAGIQSQEPSVSGLSGGDATRLMAYLNQHHHADEQFKAPVLSPMAIRLMAYGVATLEENARMKRIVACPTAGGSGSVPAVLIALEHEHGVSREQTIQGLLTAGCVGNITSQRMHLSGASAGCQAEVGVASGMAAAGMVEALGGSPSQVLVAAAISMQNLMGLVCDPVAGLVEIPCVLRNGLSAIQSVGAASMAMAGITSFIPIDDVVDAMAHVGRLMPHQLKETAEGGLATTETAIKFTEGFYGNKTT